VLVFKKSPSYTDDCYEFGEEGYPSGARIWVTNEGVILDETRREFNLNEMKQIISFMETLSKKESV
jgi:hypothetical protein